MADGRFAGLGDLGIVEHKPGSQSSMTRIPSRAAVEVRIDHSAKWRAMSGFIVARSGEETLDVLYSQNAICGTMVHHAPPHPKITRIKQIQISQSYGLEPTDATPRRCPGVFGSVLVKISKMCSIH